MLTRYFYLLIYQVFFFNAPNAVSEAREIIYFAMEREKILKKRYKQWPLETSIQI